MRVETKLPAKEIRKNCPRCSNTIVVESTNDIEVEMVYYSSFLDDFWDPPMKIPSFFCICPVCSESIKLSSYELTDKMQKQVLAKNKWYYRLWKKFKTTFD